MGAPRKYDEGAVTTSVRIAIRKWEWVRNRQRRGMTFSGIMSSAISRLMKEEDEQEAAETFKAYLSEKGLEPLAQKGPAAPVSNPGPGPTSSAKAKGAL